ncbi:MAG TPA: hypothetical protein VFI31_05145 [Pirellulales bacterium]|nr:hypothetical protein [Pirellulales bacterium]
MKAPQFGTISGRGAWATILALMVCSFALVFPALIPLAVSSKTFFHERNRKVRRMVLVNVFLAGWMSAAAAMWVELRPTPWLSDAINFAVLDFYAGMSSFGPVVLTLLWMNAFLLPSTAMYVVLGLKRSQPRSGERV